MTMEKELDVVDQYKNITNKLKKKFLKKPNLAEGSEQFETLARQQKAEDNPHYAGMCFLGQARCEQTLGNWTAEATALTEAARSFIKAHDFYHRTHCVSFLEDLHSAINCYGHAIRVNSENGQYVVAAQLSIELGNHLKRFGRAVESMQHYRRGIELLANHPSECLHAMHLLATAKLEASDYDDALLIYTDMFNFAKQTATYHAPDELEATTKEMLRHCEVNMLLMLLYLQPTAQRTSPQHSKLLEKYTWDVQEEYLESFCAWEVCETGLQAVVPQEPKGALHPATVDARGVSGLTSDSGPGLKLDSKPAPGLMAHSGSGSGGVRNYMSLDLFFALQSLAMACQGECEDDLTSSEVDLQGHLNVTQKHLTRLLVMHHVNKNKNMMQLLSS